MTEFTNEERAKQYAEIENAEPELPVLSLADVLAAQAAGRPVAHLIDPEEADKPANAEEEAAREAEANLPEYVSPADVQQAQIAQEHTQNANLEDQADGTYADAKDDAEEAQADALDDGATDEEAVKAAEDALPEGVTPAELQDAEHRGMVDPAVNARTEAQQKLLKQEVEQGEDGETTDEGLRKPENVDAEAPEEGDNDVAGAADGGHEVDGDSDDSTDTSPFDGVNAADAVTALKTADWDTAEKALTDSRKTVREAAQARCDELDNKN